VYTNSALISLNARESMRAQLRQPLSMPSTSSIPVTPVYLHDIRKNGDLERVRIDFGSCWNDIIDIQGRAMQANPIHNNICRAFLHTKRSRNSIRKLAKEAVSNYDCLVHYLWYYPDTPKALYLPRSSSRITLD
jgi:hypothetical protein